MTTKTYFPVIFTEVDGMGIVHHSNYPQWFERGRKDFLKKAGFSNSHIAGKGFFLPLIELECKFRSPARHGNIIKIVTKISSISCAKVIFDYQVFEKEKGMTLATGKTVHAWTNRKIEPVNIENAAPDIYWCLKNFSESQDNT